MKAIVPILCVLLMLAFAAPAKSCDFDARVFGGVAVQSFGVQTFAAPVVQFQSFAAVPTFQAFAVPVHGFAFNAFAQPGVVVQEGRVRRGGIRGGVRARREQGRENDRAFHPSMVARVPETRKRRVAVPRPAIGPERVWA